MYLLSFSWNGLLHQIRADSAFKLDPQLYNWEARFMENNNNNYLDQFYGIPVNLESLAKSYKPN